MPTAMGAKKIPPAEAFPFFERSPNYGVKICFEAAVGRLA